MLYRLSYLGWKARVGEECRDYRGHLNQEFLVVSRSTRLYSRFVACGPLEALGGEPKGD